jgi:hypothetical protein
MVERRTLDRALHSEVAGDCRVLGKRLVEQRGPPIAFVFAWRLCAAAQGLVGRTIV